MIRLHIIVEGRSEEGFVHSTLRDHLGTFGISTDARRVLTGRDRRSGTKHKGGLINWAHAKNDILSWIREDDHNDCRFTTMFDLYGLPDDFPGYRAAHAGAAPYQRVKMLEQEMADAIDDRRFIPYIQLHEFEALVFADPQKLLMEYPRRGSSIQALVKTVGDLAPELIDENPETAPSKRILSHIPEYGKARSGPSVTSLIGLPTLRRKCPHFDEWVTRLEEAGRGRI
ncbi:MAG: DUF4276 family protein [Methylobacteriaceae bacterium]|nr:DUF4276 family protein [Methylobacteriaceae bacterium]